MSEPLTESELSIFALTSHSAKAAVDELLALRRELAASKIGVCPHCGKRIMNAAEQVLLPPTRPLHNGG